MESDQDYYERKEEEHKELIECYAWLVVAMLIISFVMVIASRLLGLVSRLF